MDNLFSCFFNVFCSVCVVKCVITPASLHMPAHVACRAHILFVNEPSDTNSAATSTALEDMCTAPLVINNLGLRLKEGIDR